MRREEGGEGSNGGGGREGKMQRQACDDVIKLLPSSWLLAF